MVRSSRPVSWLKAAFKAFQSFPLPAQEECKSALGIAAEGGKADIAKPLRGLGAGIFEIALAYAGNAYRVVYAVQLDDALWVVHAFQKKSTLGIRTPRRHTTVVADRIRRLRQMLEK